MTDEIGVNTEMARDGSFEPTAMAIDAVVAGKAEADDCVAASPLPPELTPDVPDIADEPSDQATSSDHGEATNESLSKTAKPGNSKDLVKLADRINDAVSDFVDKNVKLGKLLLKSRNYFPQDKIGREEWKAWVKENIHLSTSRVGDLMRIASSPDPAAKMKEEKANDAKRQSTHRNKKAAALEVSAKSDSLSDVTASSEPSEHEVLIEKFAELARTWARGKTVAELQKVISEILASGDDFPEMPSCLIRGKSALAPYAPIAAGGAVT